MAMSRPTPEEQAEQDLQRWRQGGLTPASTRTQTSLLPATRWQSPAAAPLQWETAQRARERPTPEELAERDLQLYQRQGEGVASLPAKRDGTSSLAREGPLQPGTDRGAGPAPIPRRDSVQWTAYQTADKHLNAPPPRLASQLRSADFGSGARRSAAPQTGPAEGVKIPADAGGYPAPTGFPGARGSEPQAPPQAPWFDPFRYAEQGKAPLGQAVGEAVRTTVGEAVGGVSAGRERQVEERYWKQGPKVPLSLDLAERRKQLQEAEVLRRRVEPYWERSVNAYYARLSRIAARPEYQNLNGMHQQVGMFRDDALRFQGSPGGIQAGARADALEADVLRREFQQRLEVQQATEEFRGTMLPERLRQAAGGRLTPFQEQALQAISSIKQDSAVNQRYIGSGLLADLAITAVSALAGKLLAGAGVGAVRVLAEGEGPLARAAALLLRGGKSVQKARVFQGPLGQAFRPDEAAVNNALLGMFQQPAAYLALEKEPKVDRLMGEAVTGLAGGYLLHGTGRLTGGLLERVARGGVKLSAVAFRRVRARVKAAGARNTAEAALAMERALRELQLQNPEALVMSPDAHSEIHGKQNNSRFTGSTQAPAGTGAPNGAAGPAAAGRSRASPAAPGPPGTGARRRAPDPGGALLAKAVTASGALRQAPKTYGTGKTGWIRWYDVGGMIQALPAREAMYAHLEARYPHFLARRWRIPGRGTGTLWELLVEQGVLPAEVGDLYTWGREWRDGARAKPATYEAIKARAGGTAPGIPGKKVGGLPIIEPQGKLDPSQRKKWVEVAETSEFQRDINKYNKVTQRLFNTLSFWPRIKAAKNADEVIRALKSGKVRFYHTPGVTNAAIYEMVIPETGEVYYHLQADLMKDKNEDVLRHELLHLAAILNGERERPMSGYLLNIPHELAVSWATTPHLAAPATGVLSIPYVGGIWLTAQQIQKLTQKLRAPKPEENPVTDRTRNPARR